MPTRKTSEPSKPSSWKEKRFSY